MINPANVGKINAQAISNLGEDSTELMASLFRNARRYMITIRSEMNIMYLYAYITLLFTTGETVPIANLRAFLTQGDVPLILRTLQDRGPGRRSMTQNAIKTPLPP